MWKIIGYSPDWVKSKTRKLAFAARSSAKLAVLRYKNKYRLARNLDTVSLWNDISTRVTSRRQDMHDRLMYFRNRLQVIFPAISLD